MKVNQVMKNILSFRLTDAEIKKVDKLKGSKSYNEYLRYKVLGVKKPNPYKVGDK